MRAGIYYRVSSEEQIDGYSLDAQRRALLDFCQSKGWSVVGEYADEGKSARGDDLAKRPAFKRMMEDAEAGRIDVVVVHKLDRFSRNIRITFDSLARLDQCGVSFTTIVEHQFDFTTPMGKVMLSLLAAFAQYYSDNLSQETKKGKAERKAQGMYNGRIPWGMTKGPEGIPVAHPGTIDGLRLAFALAVDGESDRDIAQALNERGYRTNGYRTGRGEPFTKDTVAKMLQNRFYLGFLPDDNGGWQEGKHGAVIERETFDAAQAQRERRVTIGRTGRRADRRVYALSSLARCGHCGGKMTVQPNRGRPRLFCENRRQHGRCQSKSALMSLHEGQIGAHLSAFVIPDDWREKLIAEQGQGVIVGEDVAARRKAIEARLGRIKELYSWGDIERGEYVAERDRLQRELASLIPQEREATDDLDAFPELIADIAQAWREATPEQRNRMARALFDEVVIGDQRVVAVKPRAEVLALFRLDAKTRGLSITTARACSDGSDGIRTRGLCLDRAAC